MFEINVLGPVQVVRDGEPMAVAGPRERAILAVLAVHAGEVVSADHLIDRVWGDDPPRNPVNALQAIVSRLRRTLGSDGLILTANPGYMLDTQACDIDARRFEDLLRQASELGPAQPEMVSELLRNALSLWRGAPFADLAFANVVDEERSRLDGLRLEALEGRIDADLAAGRHSGETVAQLVQLVAAEPFRERPRAQLMLTLYRCGRQGEAITAYHETRRVLDDQLGIAPGAELKKLYERILQQDPALLQTSQSRAVETRTNLPSRITSFVGRDVETEELKELLDGNRLVTVIGPGGSGKTSVAVEVARSFIDSFDHGVWFVDFAPVSAEGVIAAIGDAVGWPDAMTANNRSPNPARLRAYLEDKHLLLILDNCEHVVQEAAEISETLLRTCPRVVILATSREVLASAGEYVWTIPPLSIPSPTEAPDQLASYDAVRLLIDRAASAGADTLGGEENTQAAAVICRRLDGMPLAIELAAARARSVSLREIAQRLNERFDLLTVAGRTIEPRHRTLRAAIDWSHDLLSPAEQTLFRRLAVFSGGWTLSAAEAICVGGEITDVVRVLGRLVDQSLVASRAGRFSMLETLQAYAAERLVDAAELDALRERHAQFFQNFAEAAEPDLRSSSQEQALARLRSEEHNLRQALHWGREHSRDQPDAGLSLAAALGWYWYVGRQIDGRSELQAMLTAATSASPAVRARGLQSWSLALRPAGCIVHPSPEAAQAARESVALFDALDVPVRAALSRLLLAVEGVAGEDVDASLELIERARRDLRGNDNSWGLALADFVEMEIRLYHDSPDAALRLGDHAAAQFDALDDNWGRSAVRLHLGIGLRLAGRVQESNQLLHHALALSQETGLPNNAARSLAELGELALHAGDAEEAERWFSLAEEIAAELADDTLSALLLVGQADAARYRGQPALARQRYQRALTLYRRSEVVQGQARTLTGLAAAALDMGNPAEAHVLLDEVDQLSSVVADRTIQVARLEQLARLSCIESRRDETERLLREVEHVRAHSRRPRSALAAKDIATVSTS